MAAHTSLPATVDGWLALMGHLQELVDYGASRNQIAILWMLGCLSLVSAVLYFVALGMKTRRGSSLALWKRDSQGYYHPCVHTCIPVLAGIYAILSFAALVCLQTDFRSHPRGRTIALQLISYQFLLHLGLTKTTAILYAIPPSPFRLNASGRKFLHWFDIHSISPTFYHALLLGYILASTVILWTTAIVLARKLDNSWWESLRLHGNVEQIISVLSGTTPTTLGLYRLQLSALQSLGTIERLGHELMVTFRVFAGLGLWLLGIQLVIITTSSFVILRALRCQVLIYRDVLRNRRELRRVHLLELTKQAPGSVKDLQAKGLDALARTDSKTWSKSTDLSRSTSLSSMSRSSRIGWMPTLKTDAGINAAVWDILHDVEAVRPVHGSAEQAKHWEEADREAKRQYERLARYYVNTAWQCGIAIAIISSFMVLLICIAANVWDVPRGRNIAQLTLLVSQWGAWTWSGGPGLILSILACVVALTPPPELAPPQAPPPRRDSFDSGILPPTPAPRALTNTYDEKGFPMAPQEARIPSSRGSPPLPPLPAPTRTVRPLHAPTPSLSTMKCCPTCHRYLPTSPSPPSRSHSAPRSVASARPAHPRLRSTSFQQRRDEGRDDTSSVLSLESSSTFAAIEGLMNGSGTEYEPGYSLAVAGQGHHRHAAGEHGDRRLLRLPAIPPPVSRHGSAAPTWHSARENSVGSPASQDADEVLSIGMRSNTESSFGSARRSEAETHLQAIQALRSYPRRI